VSDYEGPYPTTKLDLNDEAGRVGLGCIHPSEFVIDTSLYTKRTSRRKVIAVLPKNLGTLALEGLYETFSNLTEEQYLELYKKAKKSGRKGITRKGI